MTFFIAVDFLLEKRVFLFYNHPVAPVIIVFAKAPIPGRVKSRLLPKLTPGQAADLYAAFVADVIARAAEVADVELHADIPFDAWGGPAVTRRLQVDGGLGRRMLAALDAALAEGRPRAMILGGDVPTVPAGHIRAVLESVADVTLGPAEDGGFWSIAARRTHPGMFKGVRWSSGRELAQTRQAAESCGLSVDLGPLWYDVDRPEDLARLIADAGSLQYTYPVLAKMVAMPLKEGDRAPEIKLLTGEGEPFTLSSLKGKNVVLYFYPKANTPGCTTEACEFRDHWMKFDKRDTVIVGVSPDPVKAQAGFKTRYGLPFTLLADADHTAAEAYGVWQEKSMYGKKYFGVARTTFLIGPDGRIKRIFEKVKPAGHAAQLLEALAAL